MTAHLYRHFDSEDNLLYVGVSLSALHRLGQHQEHSYWYSKISRVTIEHLENRSDALLAERKAIQNEKPLHNVLKYASKDCLELISHINNSKVDFVKNIVKFEISYTSLDVAEKLGMSHKEIKKAMDDNQLGYYELLGTTGKTRRRISGWQLIEYLEYIQNKNKSTTVK